MLTLLRLVGGWLLGLFIGFSLIAAVKYPALREYLVFLALTVVAFLVIMGGWRRFRE